MNPELNTTAALEQAFPGWWIWRSGIGRWWASRRGPLSLRQLRAGCRLAVDADDAETLARRIDAQHTHAAGSLPLQRPGRSDDVGDEVSAKEVVMQDVGLLDVTAVADELRTWNAADMAEVVEFLAARLDDDEKAAWDAADPNRARRTVEAHRQILDGYLRSAIACADNLDLSSFRNALRAATIELAAIYADHPNYRAEFTE